MLFRKIIKENLSSPHGQLAAIAAASQGVRSPFAEAFADDALEREPEVFAKKRVDARIYCGVAVAQPK